MRHRMEAEAMREFTLIMRDKNFNIRRQIMPAESIGRALIRATAIISEMVDFTVAVAGLYTTANLDSDTGVLQVGRYDSKGWTAWIPKEYMEREE